MMGVQIGTVFLLLLPVLTFSLQPCSSNFTTKCLCGHSDYFGDSNQYIVNCTNTDFTDTKVLENLPVETEVLIFTGNNISALPWNIFGTSNNQINLRVLDMSSNRINEVRGKSFHRVKNVKRLILNHNNISIATTESNNHHHARILSNFDNLEELHLTDAFADNASKDLTADLHDIFINSQLPHLKKLHLEQNEILYFKDPQVFCSLPNLMDLHLGDNELTGINFNISCLEHLRFLDLERNHIMALNDSDFKSLDSLTNKSRELIIDLGGNPFKCGHEMERLCSWFQQSRVNIRNKNSIKCSKTISINTEKTLNSNEIECVAKKPLLSSHVVHETHAVATFFLTALTVILLTLVCLLLYVNRDQISYQLRPVIDTVSRKVQYTSIGKQEEHEMIL